MLNIKHRTEIISAIAALCIAIFVAMASVFMANTISALDGEVNDYIDLSLIHISEPTRPY